MVSPVARTVYPVSTEWVGYAREITPGTAVTPVIVVPVEKGQPDDKPTFLVDKALRGSMAEEYQLIEGTEIGAFDINGPVYMDTVGYLLHNIMGDYVSAGSAAANTTTLSAALGAGSVSTTVTAGTGYTTGTTVQFGPLAGVSENLTIASVTGGTALTFSTGARFSWLSGATVSTVTAPFTHTFSLLNTGNGQPVTHTLTHYTGITAQAAESPSYGGTYGARQFAYWCGSEIAFSLNAAELFMHSTKGVAFLGQPATVQPVKTITQAHAQPAWEATVTVAGGTVNSITEPAVTISRQIKPWFTADGSQNPFVIARNSVTVAGKFTHLAESDAPMMHMLNNDQPAVLMTISNGLSGGSLSSATFNIATAAYDTVKLNDNEEIEWQATWKGIATPANAGYSGGWSPISVVLVNAIPTY